MNTQHGTKKAGDLDTSFGDEGWINLNHILGFSAIVGTKVSPDGGLVVLSHGTRLAGYHISKFLPDGTLDLTFGTGGVKEDVHPGGRPRVSLELADDKILVFAAHAGSLMLARYDAHGQPDQAFGPDGKVFIALDDLLSQGKDGKVVSFAATVEPIVEQLAGPKIPNYSGGGIVTAGLDDRWFVSFRASFTDAGVVFSVVLCLTREGGVDLSFNDVGYAVIDLAGEAQNSNVPYQLRVQTNGSNRGKPVLVVHRNLDVIIVRRLASGEPDYTFGPERSSYLPINGSELGILPDVIQGSDDGLKVVGYGSTGGSSMATGRAFDANGRVDRAFNNGELWFTPSSPAGTSSRWVSGVAIGAGENFRLVVSGTTNDETDVRISQVDGAAQPDPAFGEEGISQFPNRRPNTTLSGGNPSTVRSPDGDYYVSRFDRIFKVLGH